MKFVYTFLFSILLQSASLNLVQGQLAAFPGAQGFGSTTAGGRGGQIIYVTNLNNAGAGSFREACEAMGPRIVMFKVSGLISLYSRIYIINPYITIAGQTAPGEGICIRGGQLSVSTHDVIIRYIRSRAGDNAGYNSGINPDNRDAFEIQNEFIQPYNIILDHCSASWAIDENMSTWFNCNNITIQWCIISEGLHNSLHSYGPHSKGLLIGDGGSNISVHHNLFAHNYDRNPFAKDRTTSEVVNNVMYNWGGAATSESSQAMYYYGVIDVAPDGETFSNFIGNTMKKGVDSYTENWGVRINGGMPNTSKLYLKGNVGPGRPVDTGEDWDIVRWGTAAKDEWGVNTYSFTSSNIVEQTAAQSYTDVLNGAGATLPKRDAVDTRVINSVINGTGSIINSQTSVGGWPTYNSGTALTDTDNDGMPDSWETIYGFDANSSSDGSQDADADGYTNVEEYLNNTNPISVLPIHLLDFSAKRNDNICQINWSTSFELSSDYFQVEKSDDAVNFNAISKVKSAGNSNTINEYNYIDSSNFSGAVYYRLKQYDMDARFTYSKIVSVNIAAQKKLLVQPNPFFSSTTLNATQKIVSLKVYNVNGQLVLNKKVNEKNYTLDFAGRISGLYYIAIFYSDGSKEVVKTIKK